ncbi:MAG: Dabb family protein [Oscillospiraceae bacterium]|nr:Dabb family protein [Oscillospiraceae bacterium]
MIHYVLLKIAPEADLDAVEARVRQTYAALDEALDYLNDAVVYRSCVQRDSNADLMAVVRLDGPEALQPYLTHPLHMQMAQDLKDAVIGRTSFDHP